MKSHPEAATSMAHAKKMGEMWRDKDKPSSFYQPNPWPTLSSSVLWDQAEYDSSDTAPHFMTAPWIRGSWGLHSQQRCWLALCSSPGQRPFPRRITANTRSAQPWLGLSLENVQEWRYILSRAQYQTAVWHYYSAITELQYQTNENIHPK